MLTSASGPTSELVEEPITTLVHTLLEKVLIPARQLLVQLFRYPCIVLTSSSQLFSCGPIADLLQMISEVNPRLTFFLDELHLDIRQGMASNADENENMDEGKQLHFSLAHNVFRKRTEESMTIAFRSLVSHLTTHPTFSAQALIAAYYLLHSIQHMIRFPFLVLLEGVVPLLSQEVGLSLFTLSMLASRFSSLYTSQQLEAVQLNFIADVINTTLATNGGSFETIPVLFHPLLLSLIRNGLKLTSYPSFLGNYNHKRVENMLTEDIMVVCVLQPSLDFVMYLAHHPDQHLFEEKSQEEFMSFVEKIVNVETDHPKLREWIGRFRTRLEQVGDSEVDRETGDHPKMFSTFVLTSKLTKSETSRQFCRLVSKIGSGAEMTKIEVANSVRFVSRFSPTSTLFFNVLDASEGKEGGEHKLIEALRIVLHTSECPIVTEMKKCFLQCVEKKEKGERDRYFSAGLIWFLMEEFGFVDLSLDAGNMHTHHTFCSLLSDALCDTESGRSEGEYEERILEGVIVPALPYLVRLFTEPLFTSSDPSSSVPLQILIALLTVHSARNRTGTILRKNGIHVLGMRTVHLLACDQRKIDALRSLSDHLDSVMGPTGEEEKRRRGQKMEWLDEEGFCDWLEQELPPCKQSFWRVTGNARTVYRHLGGNCE
ncbi:hypothetical protein BLNAU_3686 [Blattamonas nauphoetae]|uniref:Uncharacterized protein n=1 Tax=Blattamonas nauphoetae TaxID=2049346 RepID=A0ABQ9YBU7_9EUKA|nr:hypothetical protein BLNAU_3686 [Blattamonas nauphoetae]